MRDETNDRELYNFELDWWLNCRDAMCGVKSSFGGQIAVIESGGEHAQNLDEAGCYRHPFNDSQVIDTKHERAFGMDRRLRRRWILLRESDVGNGTQHERVLLAHYTASCPSETNGDGRQKWPKGVESRLAQWAGVAIMLTPVEKNKRVKLLMACQRGDDAAIQEARNRAERAVRAAHVAYLDIVRVEDEAWLAGEPERYAGAYAHRNRQEPTAVDAPIAEAS
jgi:hypothetical protein